MCYLYCNNIPLVPTANPDARQIRTQQLDVLKVLLDRHHLPVAFELLLVGRYFDPVASDSCFVFSSFVSHLKNKNKFDYLEVIQVKKYM